MRRGLAFLFGRTFLIQPLFLVVRVQISYVELTGMAWRRFTWMLIPCYCRCKINGKNEDVETNKNKSQKYCSTWPLIALLLPSGRTAFSHEVSFSAWGSEAQQEVEEFGSENPESEVRVVESEVWDEKRESDSPEWRAEAWAYSAWDSGSREWLSSSGSPASTVLLPPMASSPGPRPSGEPGGIVGRSTRHWDVSGDVLSDWKGGWNTLTENLHRETLRRLQLTTFYIRVILYSDIELTCILSLLNIH